MRSQCCRRSETRSRGTGARPHLSGLVGHEGALSGVLALSAGLELGEVAVVVTLHLEVEHLRGEDAL